MTIPVYVYLINTMQSLVMVLLVMWVLALAGTAILYTSANKNRLVRIERMLMCKINWIINKYLVGTLLMLLLITLLLPSERDFIAIMESRMPASVSIPTTTDLLK